MSVFEHWEQQKQSLRASLSAQGDLAGVAYAVRHALLQVEQNALAALEDDVLRQQAGVLFSGLKNSVGLMEANVMTTVWVPQSRKAKTGRAGRVTLWTAAALLQVLGGLFCYFKGFWLGWILALSALAVAACALFAARRKAAPESGLDEVRVTVKPDIDRLFSLMDGQLRAIDRYLNDFTYLNDQLRGGTEGADGATLARVADLLEALYECDDEARASVQEAARQMLEGMGLCALDYSDESRRLFTALPSKSETRTLSPAIVSKQDYRLLRRGTAAVKMDVA